MASTVPFKLITPTQVVFEGDAELVIAVTTEGEEGILPSHAPFLGALRPGILRANIVESGAVKRLELATGEGFMQALPDRCTVIVDRALRHDEIDVASARAELGEATERQKAATDPAGHAREQAAIDFANARLRLTGHH
ncbi:MAG: ATP synthase F1 subunit epsilon [Candidatus Eremiobacteraeota bacterium]|nr:ATP synthase F1 subunit epsilon [Candidatus Eremiobacteraeota bacterium]